jgi:hypothetical protein
MLEIWIEPGRYLVAAAGVLLARVTQLKSKGDVHYVGVATGMNSLIRPALYGAYHEIVNLTRLDDAPEQLVNVVGPICESGDILGHDRAAARHLRGRCSAHHQRRSLRVRHELTLQPARAGRGSVHLTPWPAAAQVRRRRLLWRSALGLAPPRHRRPPSTSTIFDRSVTLQFQGRRWTLPAQVYAAPLELYVGAPLSMTRSESPSLRACSIGRR